MRINLDLTKNQSLGNIYDEQSTDNFANFQQAKELYKINKIDIDSSISRIFEENGREPITSISIPVGHLINSGFVSKLDFIIDSITEDEASLTLTKVN